MITGSSEMEAATLAAMIENALNPEMNPSFEDVPCDVDALKEAVAKTEQELKECMEKNIRSLEELTNLERDVQELQNELKRAGSSSYRESLAVYIGSEEAMLANLRRKAQYSVSAVRTLSYTFDELKEFCQQIINNEN